MIAPSNDWFVGLSEQNLLNDNGEWLTELTLPLHAYDAGTESGDTFSLGGTSTSPQGLISRLNVTVNAPSASIIFNNYI